MQVSKDHKKKLLYNLTINCDFYYVTLSAKPIHFVLCIIMFSSNILWELTGLYIFFSYISEINIFLADFGSPNMYWHTMECLITWHGLAPRTYWHALHTLALLGTPYLTLALTSNPWNPYYLFIAMHFNPVLPCIALALPNTP